LRERGADEITGIQKALAAKDDGDLAGSVRNSYDEAELRATLTAGGEATTRPVREGADVDYDYALANEFGTQEMAAQPFFYPGYRLGKKRAKSRISRAVTKAAKRVAAS
jgi:hypothetical protein